MNAADIAATEREYDERGQRGDRLARYAEMMVKEPDQLRDLMWGGEIDLSYQLARVMREIDAACAGRAASVDAVLAACSQMQRELLAKAFDSVDRSEA